MKNQTKAYGYAGLAILCWSTVATAFKVALADMTYLQLLCVASITAFLLFSILMGVQGKFRMLATLTLRQWIRHALLGAVNPVLYYLILFKAYSLLPAQIAQPLNCSWPLILVFLSLLVLKQPIPTTSFIGLFISFSGVLTISLGRGVASFSGDAAGILLALGSAVVWAIYWIFNIKNKLDDVVGLFLNFMFSVIYIIPIVWITGMNMPTYTSVGAAVYVGIFEMGITFLFWLKALKLAKTTTIISQMSFLSPFISLIFIYFILREHIYFSTVLGLLLIIGGIILNAYLQTRNTKQIKKYE